MMITTLPWALKSASHLKFGKCQPKAGALGADPEPAKIRLQRNPASSHFRTALAAVDEIDIDEDNAAEVAMVGTMIGAKTEGRDKNLAYIKALKIVNDPENDVKKIVPVQADTISTWTGAFGSVDEAKLYRSFCMSMDPGDDFDGAANSLNKRLPEFFELKKTALANKEKLKDTLDNHYKEHGIAAGGNDGKDDANDRDDTDNEDADDSNKKRRATSPTDNDNKKLHAASPNDNKKQSALTMRASTPTRNSNSNNIVSPVASLPGAPQFVGPFSAPTFAGPSPHYGGPPPPPPPPPHPPAQYSPQFQYGGPPPPHYGPGAPSQGGGWYYHQR